MSAYIVKRRTGSYAVVVAEGMQPSRRCTACRVVVWVAESRDPVCPACSGAWSAPFMRRRQRWISGFRTRREAEATRIDVLGRQMTGTYVSPLRLTLASFLEEHWLPAVCHTVRETTFDSYRRNLANHVVPRLGAHPLQKLGPGHLNALYAELLEGGPAAGRWPPRRSTTCTRRCQGPRRRRALNLAPRNPAVDAQPPRRRATRAPEMRTWSTEEVSAFLAHVRDDRLYAARVLAAATGLRRGELLGLRWSDLDLEGRTLTVRQTLVCVAYRLVFSEPKTAKGRRSVALDPVTAETLADHGRRQAEERAFLGLSGEAELVFTAPEGEPVHPDGFSQSFERHVARSGLPRIRLHDLRHSHASHLVAAGVHVKVISERLGHASVAFTMDRYGHLLPNLQADSAEAVARTLFVTDRAAPELATSARGVASLGSAEETGQLGDGDDDPATQTEGWEQPLAHELVGSAPADAESLGRLAHGERGPSPRLGQAVPLRLVGG